MFLAFSRYSNASVHDLQIARSWEPQRLLLFIPPSSHSLRFVLFFFLHELVSKTTPKYELSASTESKTKKNRLAAKKKTVKNKRFTSTPPTGEKSHTCVFCTHIFPRHLSNTLRHVDTLVQIFVSLATRNMTSSYYSCQHLLIILFDLNCVHLSCILSVAKNLQECVVYLFSGHNLPESAL